MYDERLKKINNLLRSGRRRPASRRFFWAALKRMQIDPHQIVLVGRGQSELMDFSLDLIRTIHQKEDEIRQMRAQLRQLKPRRRR